MRPRTHLLLSEQAVVLIYELLDAHDDTARLAGDLVADSDWRAHLEYLRALHRAARELLAQTTLEGGDLPAAAITD